MTLKILAVSGSMRENSQGRRALESLLETAQKHGSQTRLLDLNTLDLPMFRPGARAEDTRIKQALEAVQWADAFVLGTPDYHGSMSGAMKNFLDYHWREFAGKLFAYLCTSHEKGLTAMEQMRTTVRQCYGWSLPYGVSFDSSEAMNEKGEITSEALANRLRMTARDLVIYGSILHQQLEHDLAAGNTDTFVARYRQ